MNAIEITHPTPIVRAAAPAAERNFERELFEQLRSAWKAAAKAKALSPASLAAWAIIRGADPKRGFSPVTNPVKLANGAQAWGAYDQAAASCSRCSAGALAPWAELLGAQGAALKGWQWSGAHPLLALLAKPLA